MAAPRKSGPIMDNDHDVIPSRMRGRSDAATAASPRASRRVAKPAAVWATATAVLCSTFLVANRVEDTDGMRPSTGVGFESLGPERVTEAGHARVEPVRTPHNLYRFSGARAAVASMAHGF